MAKQMNFDEFDGSMGKMNKPKCNQKKL